MATQTTIPPWSYSAINTFDTCPKQYYHRYILKEKDPQTEVMLHGIEVHRALEYRLRDKKPLPEYLLPHEKLVLSIEKAAHGGDVHAELPLAITKDFTPCGFFDADVWGRGKADIVVQKKNKLWVGDWKTGKVREKKFQVQVFAAFIFKMFPEAEIVYANNLWLQENKIGENYLFTREGEKALWADILYKISRIEQAYEKNKFDPKPSGLCGSCPVKSCPHNSNRS
ncbi:MAG: PD-(D/E)XK nuclease family protein [Patescibacteria group bacterium]|nr:PD-(D/E)XK nuclease family protein [Patescibacteria group bacterium]